MIDFFIEGVPAPGGSKTAVPIRTATGDLVCRYVYSKRFRRAIPIPALKYIDSGGSRKNKGTGANDIGAGNKSWKKVVAAAAKRQYRSEPLDGSLRVLFRFMLRRPASHHVAGDRHRPLKDRYSGVLHPDTKPDTMKLARSTEDALTGILWRDDALNAQVYAEKRYAATDEPTGVRVMVTEVVPEFAPAGLFDEEGRG